MNAKLAAARLAQTDAQERLKKAARGTAEYTSTANEVTAALRSTNELENQVRDLENQVNILKAQQFSAPDERLRLRNDYNPELSPGLLFAPSAR